MGKHWIYVIRSEEFEEDEETIYIGQTRRLYRRFFEHMNGKGSVNTSSFESTRLIGIYNVIENEAFEQYHSNIARYNESHDFNKPIWDFRWEFKTWRNRHESEDFLEIENLFTEMYLYLHKHRSVNVKGGKYTRNIDYKQMINSFPSHRPLCDCGLPAEVFLSNQDKVFFKCCISNGNWIDLGSDYFSVDEPCNFIQQYDDKHVRDKYNVFKGKVENPSLDNISRIECLKGSPLMRQSAPCSVCQATVYKPMFYKGYRSICHTCIDKRYDDVLRVAIPLQFDFLPD